MKDNKNAFRLEITDVGNDCISIKSPIILSREQYNLIQKICDMTDERLEQYILDALMQSIEIDLNDPTIFGLTVCEVLRKQWDPIKPK
jgi:hypothetical protein